MNNHKEQPRRRATKTQAAVITVIQESPEESLAGKIASEEQRLSALKHRRNELVGAAHAKAPQVLRDAIEASRHRLRALKQARDQH